ncbi:MAG: flagellar hook protein FlgE [Rhodospirillaceae bacterium]|nr:flagellar hook protein FlgE [Rhodospirillaceae bacterium]
MSLYGALFTGVTGLTAQTQSIAMISDNLANVNTIGFKGNVARFATLVTQSGTVDTFSPGGVRSRPFARIAEQGTISATTSNTDIAISGNGFFVVNSRADGSGEPLYTRAGSFTQDATGNLVNTAGLFLQGWPLDSAGNLPASQEDLTSIETVNVAEVSGQAAETTQVDLGMNLNASLTTSTAAYSVGDMQAGTVTPDFTRDFVIFDSLGSAHDVTVAFLKQDPGGANNTWQVEVFHNGGDVAPGNELIDSGTLVFNGDASIDGANSTLGSLDPTTGELVSTLTIPWNNGANPGSVELDWGTDGLADGLTQFDSDFDVNFVNQNGAEVGRLNNVSIDDEGFVIASFNNGTTKRLYKLPLSVFANPSGLEARSGNAYAQTDRSGEFNLREAGTGGSGSVVSTALEQSNIDIAKEFTDMITTQRAYSANTRVISTVDDMLDELIRVKR